MYHSERFKITEEVPGSNEYNKQLAYQTLMYELHHKNCNKDHWDLLNERSLDNLLMDGKAQEVKSIVNDMDTLIVCSEHKMKDHINAY